MPIEASDAASFIDSDKVGCAWQIREMSSAVNPASIAATASPMSSPAWAPMICTAKTLSLSLSDKNLILPTVSPVVFPLAFALKGKIPFLKFIFLFSNSFSVGPTQATSGSV